jgi:hypothetical protein
MKSVLRCAMGSVVELGMLAVVAVGRRACVEEPAQRRVGDGRERRVLAFVWHRLHSACARPSTASYTFLILPLPLSLLPTQKTS